MTTPIITLGQDEIYEQILEILVKFDETADLSDLIFSSNSRKFSFKLNNNPSVFINYSKFTDDVILDASEENNEWSTHISSIINKEINKPTFKKKIVMNMLDEHLTISDITLSPDFELTLTNAFKYSSVYSVYCTESNIKKLQETNPGLIEYNNDSLASIGSYELQQIKKINKELKQMKLKGQLVPKIISKAIPNNPQVIQPFIKRIGADLSSRNIGTQEPDFPIPDDICVFVIDTGVYRGHPDLNIDENLSRNFTTEKDWSDRNGHGTHVAGIIGAIDNNTGVVGVAPGVKIISYKVFNATGSGSSSNINKAIDAVTDFKKKNPTKKCIVNMSLGSSVDRDKNERVDRCVNEGVIVVVSAGNKATDANTASPASAKKAITVGAYDDSNNEFASFSNFGTKVNVLAPGVNILSTYIDNEYQGYKSLSGTSMAAPVVTGAIVNMIAKNMYDKNKDLTLKDLTPQEIINKLREDSDNRSNPNPQIIKVPKSTYSKSIYIGNDRY
jgi:hypothetical protein